MEQLNGGKNLRYTKEQLDELQQVLYTAVLSDIMDSLNIHDFCLSAKIKPTFNCGKLIGYARTLHATDVFIKPEKPYQKELLLLDNLQEGDVLVSLITGSNHNGFVGELISTACIARGSRGAILDGFIRDTAFMDLDKFPVYSKGTSPLDSYGRVDTIEIDTPIICGGVLIRPRDIVFADTDGVVVVPSESAKAVFEKAMEKVSGENLVREELKNGSSIVEVFNKYGIL